jgi:hypothetical protein
MFVFDIETDRLLNAARDNWSELRMTVCAAVTPNGTRHCYTLRPDADDEHAAVELADLCRALDEADRLVAYNGREFDLRVLGNHFGRERAEAWATKLADPFELIRAATGSWVSLDELLAANGLPVKTGSGVDAVAWWAAGEYDRVAEYCRQDAEALHTLVTRFSKLRFPVKRWVNGEHVIGSFRKLCWQEYLRPSPPSPVAPGTP